MAESVFHSVATATDYEIGYGDYGSVYLSWTFDVWIKIYAEPVIIDGRKSIGRLHCIFPAGTRATARYESRSMTGQGSGFWNAAGIMWGDGVFTKQKMPLKLYPYGNDNDDPNAMLAQLDAATSDYFIRFAFADDQPNPQLHVDGDPGAEFEREIYESELTPEGNLPELKLAMLFTRFYDHKDPYDPSYEYAARVEQAGEVTSAAMHIDWHYYPWARKLSGDWESCNRDFDTTPSSIRSAYLRRKESGSWQDVLNNIQNANDQMSWRKQSGSWKYALPYGNNA